MSDFKTEYQIRTNEELLQIWVERSQLTPEARLALQDEIHKRGLTSDAEHATDVWAAPPEPPLAPPVNTYIGLSVLWFCLRESWLRFQTKKGVSVEAKVESTCQTRKRIRSPARAELRYFYAYEGQRYSGRTVRDFTFNKRAADALAFGHKRGDAIMVRIVRENPGRSYFPSGFGWIGWADALLTGGAGLFVVVMWVIILFSYLYRR